LPPDSAVVCGVRESLRLRIPTRGVVFIRIIRWSQEVRTMKLARGVRSDRAAPREGIVVRGIEGNVGWTVVTDAGHLVPACADGWTDAEMDHLDCGPLLAPAEEE
jgi:hypothetical protein